ncbi:ATP-binding protein [Streptomyces sp. NK08204]|uniref:ATP-binding protein n=1 Tax=Streptomyces sp. NK08204 TaxID=2873260 RepID=UPI001CECCF82|nr:ATP-binding protein [Streptomyces sp. NK08204]
MSRNTVAKALRLEDLEFEENPDVAPEPIGELRNPAWASGGRVLVLLIGVGTAIARAGLTARYSRKGATLPFQVFTERKERKATAVASNTPLRERDKTFPDPRPCAAIAGRLTFTGTLNLIGTGTASCPLKATDDEYRSARRS